jgi:hypothetical protein
MEQELALQAELAYRRLVSDWQRSRPKQVRARHRGAHLLCRQSGKQRDRALPLALRFSSSSTAPSPKSSKETTIVQRT